MGNAGVKKTARARPQRTVPKVGSVIAKRYEVGKVLGTGGFGVVVEARQTNLDRRVAIKLIWHDIAQKQSNKVRFLNEARNYARIDNPHVVKVHDCGELPDGRLFLVMEYLEGQNLHELIQASGRLSVDDMRDICAQIAFGLAGAHDRGFVHRDIKPRNIMISKTADGRRFVKLLDFGLGHISDEVEDDDDEAPTAAELEKGVTMAGKTCGTPKYMSPEQIMAKDVDPRSDIYSLGICLYEMATGRVPFEGPDLPSFTAQHALEPHRPIAEWRKDDPLPSRLNGIIDTCLAKRPADRYRTAHSLVADLEELADELASERMAPTWTPSDDNGPSRMTAEVNQEADHEKEASNSELGNVTKAVRACSRSFKCLQLYPANSPFVTEALEAAAELLAGVLEKRPWIGLSIERSSMMFCGETVYEDEDLRDSLPFRLFDDGIRRLYIDAGIDVG